MINYRIRLQELQTRCEALKKELSDCDVQYQYQLSKLEKLEKIKNIFVQSSVIGKRNSRQCLSTLVTEGLAVVHPHNLSFKIYDYTSHGKAGCVFKLQCGSTEASLSCFGGGIRNIIAVILRFIFAEFLYPKMTLPLILDEVGSNLSIEYQEKFGQLVYTLSKKFDRQVILITHQKTVMKHANKIIEVDFENGNSYIKSGGVTYEDTVN